MKILIAEDERSLLDSIHSFLVEKGFVCTAVSGFQQAIEKIGDFDYDIVVLDIGLPGGSGLGILKELKAVRPETGVLIISAKDSLDDKLAGLNLGADDYLTKPFHLSELNARINAILRRRNFRGQNMIRFNEIEINPDSMAVKIYGKVLELTKKEYDLLLYLVVNRKRVVSKEAIAIHLWGDYAESSENFDFIYSHIKNLRKKIDRLGGEDYIKTVYGLGYKFTDE